MKDENFRKLLVEYAEEMRDPETRKVRLSVEQPSPSLGDKVLWSLIVGCCT
jgi:hypothetical protein